MNRVYPGDTEGNDVEKLCAQITALDCRATTGCRHRHARRIQFLRRRGKLGKQHRCGGWTRRASCCFRIFWITSTAETGDLRAFTYDTNAPKGSLNREMHHLLGVDTYTIETSQKLPLETRIRQQLTFVEGLLTLYGIPYQMDLPQ